MHERRKIRFIANPYSGAKRKRNLSRLIEEELDHDQFSYELCFTEYAGHAVSLAREGVEAGLYMVVVCGGDGSVNEVAGQLIGTPTILGVLPCGSGNGFAMHLGIGRDVKKAVRFLNQGRPILVDSCLMNGRPFVNLAGIGFDGAVAKRLHESRTRGFKAYFRYTFEEVASFRLPNLRIQLDGHDIQRKCLLLEVANAPIYGYGFSIVPHARINDGQLEVLLVKEAPVWRYILESWRFVTRTFHKSPLVECFTCKEVRIIPEHPTAAHLDGEGFGLEGEAVFTIRPQSLRVMVPKVYGEIFGRQSN